ncbi:hypothetical protein Tco_1394476 [Tanacetum coccineum]
MKRMQNVPYALAVGSIMYVVRCTRPDVAFVQNITSRFQQNSGEAYWTAVKNILKYLEILKTVLGLMVVFVLNGGAMVWKSSKQSTSAQHAKEVEYIAASESCKRNCLDKEVLLKTWRSSLNDYPIKMNYDNSAAIIMAKESGIQKGAPEHFKENIINS